MPRTVEEMQLWLVMHGLFIFLPAASLTSCCCPCCCPQKEVPGPVREYSEPLEPGISRWLTHVAAAVALGKEEGNRIFSVEEDQQNRTYSTLKVAV